MDKTLKLKKAVRTSLFIIPAAVLGNIIYALSSSGDTGFGALFNISVHWLLLAVFISLSPWVVAATRLGLWGHFFRLKMNTRKLFEIVLANDVAAAATPTAIGGGYAKLGLLAFHGASPGLATSIMVIGSLEEYIAFAIIIPICWFMYPPENVDLIDVIGRITPSLSTLLISLLIAAVGITVVFYARRMPMVQWLFRHLTREGSWYAKLAPIFANIARDFRNAFALIKKGGKTLFIVNIILASVQWTLRYNVFTVLAFGLGIQPHPIKFFLLQWLLFTIMNVVPTPGAIGGAEVGFALLFHKVIPADLIGISGSAWRFVATYLQLIIAAVMLLYLEKPQKKSTPEKDHSNPLKIVKSEQVGFQATTTGKISSIESAVLDRNTGA